MYLVKYLWYQISIYLQSKSVDWFPYIGTSVMKELNNHEKLNGDSSFNNPLGKYFSWKCIEDYKLDVFGLPWECLKWKSWSRLNLPFDWIKCFGRYNTDTIQMIGRLHRDDSFSTYATFSGKLTFLIPWYVSAGQEILFFSENFAYVLNQWSHIPLSDRVKTKFNHSKDIPFICNKSTDGI